MIKIKIFITVLLLFILTFIIINFVNCYDNGSSSVSNQPIKINLEPPVTTQQPTNQPTRRPITSIRRTTPPVTTQQPTDQPTRRPITSIRRTTPPVTTQQPVTTTFPPYTTSQVINNSCIYICPWRIGVS